MHRLSDLRAAGAEGSREVRLAEGLLADAETKVVYAQPPDQLAAGARTARPDRHRGRAAAPPAPRLGAVEGRAALVPRPAPALLARARDRRHRRAHGREDGGMRTRAARAAIPRRGVGRSRTRWRSLALWLLGALIAVGALLWLHGSSSPDDSSAASWPQVARLRDGLGARRASPTTSAIPPTRGPRPPGD